MDWVDEKMETFRIWIRNLPIKKALIAYLCIAAVAALLLSFATTQVCERWMDILVERNALDTDSMYASDGGHYVYYHEKGKLSAWEQTGMIFLQEISKWCPFVYTVITMLVFASFFYRKRLKKPFTILEGAVDRIGRKDLDFTVSYASEDEMGRLCASFEEMRKSLEENQKEMWKLVENQKQLNAAFAHDLRTPLTVIRGYSDFLVRYLPKGTISQEKLKDTLGLLAEQCGRLERFSGTMKSLRSVEEIPFHPVRKKSSEIAARILGMVDALNMAKEVRICYRNQMKDQKLYLDEDLFLEVLDNLLSNANRYAESHVEILTETEGDILYLFVSDDGPGFSEDALLNASHLYFSEGTKEEHFGIGLNLSAILCRKHGGDVSYTNCISGNGAVVSASFRIRKEI